VDGADALLVGGAGLIAGAVNAVAGGGTLIAFPALLATGLPAVTANITSSVGLLTGYAGGALGYRRELTGQADRMRALGPAAALGGLAGAVVLLITPAESFRVAAPYLVLVACLLLAAQPRLAVLVARRRAVASVAPGSELAGAGGTGAAGTAAAGTDAAGAAASGAGSARTTAVRREAEDDGPAVGRPVTGRSAPADPVTWPTRIGVFVAGAYGSYFGAGLGVLLLGVLGILLADDLRRTNALKTLLSFVVNAVGVVVFLCSAQVAWAVAGILVGASALGGVLGARAARLLPAAVLRAAVVTLGVTVAVVLLWR
jgi:uncharacterized protein